MRFKVLSLVGLLFTTTMFAQNIQVNQGWQLLGATEDISVAKFDGKCVDFVWRYDNGWQVHIANGKSYDIPKSVISLNTIKKGKGFWVKANSNCDIDTNSTDSNTTSDIKALLAGKTFYVVDKDDDGYLQLTQLTFNDTLTSIQAVNKHGTENWGMSLSGNRLTFSDDMDGSYTIVSAANSDYVTFTDYNGDGSLDGDGHRLYYDKAKAEEFFKQKYDEYLANTKEVTFSGKVIFKDENGNIVSKPNDAKIEIRPSSDTWDPKIEIPINQDGTFSKTVRVEKDLFLSDSTFTFVVYGDTNHNDNWDGDSGKVNNVGVLENDIRYLDTDKMFDELSSIVVTVK